jgi:hypothetical protein
MGVGAAISVGSFVTAGYLTGTAAAVLGGAIIGAAIGGLSAAVMGGDIGKGVLFGAIGGAVMGGISGAMATAATSTTTTATTTTAGVGAGTGSGTLTVGMGSQSVLGGGVQVTTKGIGSTLVTETTKAKLLENAGAYLGVNALTEGVKGYLANEAADKQAEALSEQNELQRQHEKDMLQMKLEADAAGSGASGGDALAYQARMAELEQRRKEFERTMGLQEEQWGETKKATAARKALFEGVGRDRGATVESDNTVAEVGIFDKLEEKPVSALKTERILAS